MSDLIERLMSHMGLADMQEVLKDCREAAARIEALEKENAELRKALERSITAIDDWLNIYAEELCDPARVADAKARTNEYGTLWYIATTQEANRSALRNGGDET